MGKEIKTAIPDASHVRKLNIWPPERLRSKYEYVDKSQISDIAHGMGICGGAPYTGGLKSKETNPTITTHESHGGVYENNKKVSRDIQKYLRF